MNIIGALLESREITRLNLVYGSNRAWWARNNVFMIELALDNLTKPAGPLRGALRETRFL